MWWLGFSSPSALGRHAPNLCFVFSSSQVKEAMQRIHDRGNIGKLILDVEKTPTPLVSQKQRDPFSSTQEVWSGAGTDGAGGNIPGPGLAEVTSDNQRMAQIRDATNWDKCWEGTEKSSVRAFQEQSEGSQERIETDLCLWQMPSIGCHEQEEFLAKKSNKFTCTYLTDWCQLPLRWLLMIALLLFSLIKIKPLYPGISPGMKHVTYIL